MITYKIIAAALHNFKFSGAICEATHNPSASDYVTVAFIQNDLISSYKERNWNDNKR